MILEKNFSPENIVTGIREQSAKIKIFLSEKRFEKIYQNLIQINQDNFFHYISEKNIQITTLLDDNFPEKIRHIHQVPFVIYTLGTIRENIMNIGIVGSRKNTHYGENVLKKIIDEIPVSDIGIISGGAYGIDSLAHELALKKNLYTLAVFGCGIDIIYPKTNKNLFEKIISSGGGLLSIFPIGSEPETFHFPIRNEIVAWFADAILIPEAWLKSGTLITAQLALELWKDVFAVPWDIFRATSEGCNHLINAWEAKCTLSANDIFEEFPTFQATHPFENLQIDFQEISQKSEKIFSSNIAKQIFDAIADNHNTIDEIITATQIDISTVSIELTLLELDGHIINQNGFYSCNF